MEQLTNDLILVFALVLLIVLMLLLLLESLEYEDCVVL